MSSASLCTVLLVGVGCKPKPKRVPPLCAFNVASDEEVSTKTLTPSTWLGLVSPTIDRKSMTRRGPLRDSCGLVLEDVSVDDEYKCPGHPIDSDRVESDKVEEEDLVLSQIGEGSLLLWAATEEFKNGEAAGPVSLALWSESGIEIHAAGALRGFRQSARMKLHHVGSVPVIIVESERCRSARDCVAVAQAIPIIARHTRELPVYEEGRGCIGRAQFELSRKHEVDLDGRWVRRFKLIRSIELLEGSISMTDLVTMEDHDSQNPDVPPTPFRKVSANRPLELQEDRWELRDEDLWNRALRDFGSTRVREDESKSGVESQ